MKRFFLSAAIVLALAFQPAIAQTNTPAPAPVPRAGGQGRGAAQPVQAKPEELAKIKDETEQIEALVKDLKAKHAKPELVGDVEVFAYAGQMLLEFPDMFASQAAIDHAFTNLDRGIERGQQLQANQPQWHQGKKQVLAYTSEIDGAVLPYGVTLPDNYDPSKPARLYVSLHGRQNNTTESEFIYGFLGRRGNGGVADQGQIQIDCFGRVNGAGWHWAGEADIFEAIAAVKKRFNIDDKRIILRGFSMGGEGAWHIALHYPDRFAAAEVGAGTWSRRAETPGYQPYQYATLKIWENMPDWALNIFNLPLAGHDGDSDTQIPSLPGPPPGAPNRGQLESSLRTRAQLAREGFQSEGDPDFLRVTGTPGIFLISQNTGHGTSPLVRQRLDAFLKEWGDKGQTSPDHLRFLTYTTRYNSDYWASLKGLENQYERAEIDAQRSLRH
jgi:pimeloyl-ACP methyl ester carboxylesterase